MDENIFEIDQNQLDVEWVQQPRTFYEYAKKLAKAKARWERSKSALDVVRAELHKKVMHDPASYDIVKVTVDAVTNVITLLPEFQVAQEEVHKRKYTVDINQAAVNALDHKKAALERLVSLHGQSYFATPQAKDAAGVEVQTDIEKKHVQKKTVKKKKKRRTDD
jgi:hypothetical protein